MAIYIQKAGQQIGPLEDDQALAAIREHIYSPDDFAWRQGMAVWQPLRSLFPAVTDFPPPPFAPQAPAYQPKRLGDDAGMRLLLPVGRSAWAIAAGYLGLFSLIVLPAPIALIVSILAIRDIRKSRAMDEPKYGMGRAIFGLIMGILGTAGILIVAFLR